MAAAGSATLDSIDARVEAFCLRLIDFAERAAGGSPRTHRFSFVDQAITLRIAGRHFEKRLTRAIGHAAVGTGDAGPPLRVVAVDACALGAESPPGWPFPYADRRHLERLHVTADRASYATFNEDTRTWQVFDRRSRRAAIWTENAAALPEWEDSFPLRTLLNWLFAPSPASLAHAAVVADRKRGLLLAGAGGSGKSSTTAACLGLGLATCGDDFVAVTGGTSPTAWTLYDTLKLDDRSLRWFPRLAEHACNAAASPESKARIHLSEATPHLLLRASRIHDLVVPRIATGEPTRLEPLAKTAALRALAPTTLFLTRGAERETAGKLAGLVRSLPTWALHIGGTPDEAARALQGLLVGAAA